MVTGREIELPGATCLPIPSLPLTHRHAHPGRLAGTVLGDLTTQPGFWQAGTWAHGLVKFPSAGIFPPSSTAATGTFCSGGLRAPSVPCPVLPCQVWGQCFVLGITLSCPILAPYAIHAIIIPILQISKVGLGEARPLVGGPRDPSSEAGIRTYSKEQQLPLRTSLISMPPSAPCSGSSL